jgi:hypothetical protein
MVLVVTVQLYTKGGDAIHSLLLSPLTTSAGEDVGKKELSYTAGGNVD